MTQLSRRQYDADFKKNAVALADESGRTMVDVEESLGIPRGTIGKWRKKLHQQGPMAFPGNGIKALPPEQKRVLELEKKLKDVEQERDILKKALAIFRKASK